VKKIALFSGNNSQRKEEGMSASPLFFPQVINK
jgi:hypothetical protein